MIKDFISKVLCLKKLIVWGGIGCCCVIAEGVFVKRCVADLSAGKDIFFPGVLLLVLAVLAVLCFSVTRVIKYAGMLLREND